MPTQFAWQRRSRSSGGGKVVEEVTLTAPDISCDHCIAAIRKALSNLPGVQFLDGNPQTKQVTIRYDPSVVQLTAIEKVMEEEGYPPAR
jgi:copper chaperone